MNSGDGAASGATAAPMRSARGVRLLLAGSLVLNALLAGALGGVIWRDVAHRNTLPRPEAAMERLVERLPARDRRAVRAAVADAIAAAGPDLARLRAEERAASGRLAEALRAEPFAAAAFRAAAAERRAVAAERGVLIEALAAERLPGLPLATRIAIAARLERRGRDQD